MSERDIDLLQRALLLTPERADEARRRLVYNRSPFRCWAIHFGHLALFAWACVGVLVWPVTRLSIVANVAGWVACSAWVIAATLDLVGLARNEPRPRR